MYRFQHFMNDGFWIPFYKYFFFKYLSLHDFTLMNIGITRFVCKLFDENIL